MNCLSKRDVFGDYCSGYASSPDVERALAKSFMMLRRLSTDSTDNVPPANRQVERLVNHFTSYECV